ncbi:unnamed protein product [Angiostrongylus costaricensis]|uniref:Ubiquitin-like domain-containing protein n=1 Tax=Angiostrongylus costaricensis TaxID=334426 RepID=A0A0R3PKZ9_ANGCS|nr:unnamed protein product [Angiostrongylus costaricensis]
MLRVLGNLLQFCHIDNYRSRGFGAAERHLPGERGSDFCTSRTAYTYAELQVITLMYCAIGLALTTIAIEIAADALKKLHYFGRKVENVASIQVWFGGKKMSMKALVKNLGDQFNVPIEELETLNLEQFVDNAIKVEAGELATLRVSRPPYPHGPLVPFPFSLHSYMLQKFCRQSLDEFELLASDRVRYDALRRRRRLGDTSKQS